MSVKLQFIRFTCGTGHHSPPGVVYALLLVPKC